MHRCEDQSFVIEVRKGDAQMTFKLIASNNYFPFFLSFFFVVVVVFLPFFPPPIVFKPCCPLLFAAKLVLFTSTFLILIVSVKPLMSKEYGARNCLKRMAICIKKIKYQNKLCLSGRRNQDKSFSFKSFKCSVDFVYNFLSLGPSVTIFIVSSIACIGHQRSSQV